MVLRTCSFITALCLIACTAYAGGFGWWAAVQGGGDYWPTEGLEAAWTFDDGSVDDVSGNGNDGTNVNAVATDNYMVFNGSNARIDFGASTSFDRNTVGSLSMWIYADDTSLGGFLSKGGISSTSLLSFRKLTTPHKTQLLDTVNRASTADDTTFSTETWYHIVYTSDGIDYKIYVDKNDETLAQVGVNTGNWFGDFNTLYEVYMGVQRRGSSFEIYFDGRLDDTFIYDDVLTTGEIEQLYER